MIIGPLMAIYCNDKIPVGPTDAEYFESITAIIRRGGGIVNETKNVATVKRFFCAGCMKYRQPAEASVFHFNSQIPFSLFT